MILRRLALLWLIFLGAWILAARAPHLDLSQLLASPHFPEQILGRDAFGRDLVAALADAMRRSLLFALFTTLSAVLVGLFCGSALGMMKGRLRYSFERVLDFTLAFPPFLLALAVQAAFGAGWKTLLFAVSFGLFPSLVRFVAVRAKEVSVAEHVEAARALGAKPWSIFRRHYLPDLSSHLRLKLPTLVAQALLLEATLSFLNLGVSPGVLSWGSLLAQAKDYLIEAPHIAWAVGSPLVLTLLALQFGIDSPEQRQIFDRPVSSA